jgi:hypothetical protein
MWGGWNQLTAVQSGKARKSPIHEIRYESIDQMWTSDDIMEKGRMTLLQKKGDIEVIGDVRPISITNCAYRIFTCLLARPSRDISAKHRAFTDLQTGFRREHECVQRRRDNAK